MKAWRVTSDLKSDADPTAQQTQLFGEETAPQAE
jgi:hypothetical protein